MERLFSIILITTIAVFMALGAVLYSIGKDGLLLDSPQYDVIQTSFVMDEPKPKVVKREEPKPKPPPQKKLEDIPIDLTKQVKVEETPSEPVRERQVRQVYGLKKVFSQGLGVGGESEDALVGKVGNTLDKDYDTLTAKADDFKGKPVANPAPQRPAPTEAAITKRPRLQAGFRNLKPQYSKEMLQNRVEGVVKARILIGSDGIIRQIEILEDIGYDSADIAREFLMTLRFEPAMRGDQAVSVWIPFSIKFELI